MMNFLLFLLIGFSSAQRFRPTTTTTPSSSDGGADTLTLVLVFVFLTLFIIVFCIICYIRNNDYTPVNDGFSPLLLPSDQRKSTGQNAAFFGDVANGGRDTTYDTRLQEQAKVRQSAPAVGSRESSNQNLFAPKGPEVISSLIGRKKTSSVLTLNRPQECPIVKMNDFTIDEILSRDNYSIQYRGSYSDHTIRIIRIEGAIEDEEDIAGFKSYVNDVGSHPSVFPVYGIAEEDGALFILTSLQDSLVKLRHFVRDLKPNILQKYQVLLKCAEAYAHIHDLEVVIRHISTDDVMIDSQTNLVYIDYFTKFYFRPTDAFRFLSKRSLTDDTFDLTSDRYSFAVVIWEVLSGKVAWRRRSTIAELQVAVVVENERLEMDPIWPPQLRKILNRAFDEDDSMKMSDMAQVLQDLVSLYGS